MIHWHRIGQSIINYVTIHIFLTLISLPILVAWGIPLSLLSLIGNIIFSPLLYLFLLIASLGFFSELIGIPHAYLDWLLEQLTQCWQWALSLAPGNVLYGFHSAPALFLIGIALIALFSTMHPSMHHPLRRFSGLTLLLTISIALLKANEPSSLIHHVPCNHGTVTLIRTNKQTIVIDPGCIGSRISAQSWISYTFLPELITQTGSLTIDHLIILKPTILTFDAIDTLLNNAHIGHFYFPYMHGNLQGSLKRSFGKLYAQIKQQKIPITRFYNQKQNIILHEQATLIVYPNGQNKYQTIHYPRLSIEGAIDGQCLDMVGQYNK